MRKMVKRVSASLVITLMVLLTLGVAPIKDNAAQNSTSYEVQYETVLSDGLHPFPGYNMSYAPSYYDANVKEFQTQLNHYSDATYCGTPDGFFGSKTLTAVKNFQSMEGLTIDGIVGRITWDRIFGNDY